MSNPASKPTWSSPMLGRATLVLLIVAAAVLPVLPGMPVFWITLLNNVGLGALVALGLVVLTGVGGLTSFGQAAFCGFGAFTTAVLTTRYGWSPWAHATGGAGHHRHGRPGARPRHGTPLRPLPAARHHRLGHQPLLPVRRAGAVPSPRRHQRHPALQHRRLGPLRQPRHLLRDLDLGAAGGHRHPQPAQLAHGPGHPRPARRGAGGGVVRCQHHAGEARRFRLRGAARRHLGLALCPHAARREPDTVQHQRRHRVPADGGARRRGLRRRRHSGSRHRHADGGPAAAHSAGAVRQQGQLRDDRVRCPAGAAAADRPRRPVAASRCPHPGPLRPAASTAGGAAACPRHA